MATNTFIHLDAFSKQTTLVESFGEGNAHLVWVMSMYLDVPDSLQLGIDSLTDGPNDKKLDFLHLDADNRRIVFVQGYYSSKKSGEAPANKASDLNTAAAWLLSGDVAKLPTTLADSIRLCRQALDAGEIDEVELLYVHNLLESKAVQHELDTAKAHLAKGLSKLDIQISAKEIGLKECEKLFLAKESAIVVLDEIVLPSQIGFEEAGPNWNAAITSLPGTWLSSQFQKYGTQLFSANYRGFLGVSKRRKINSGIQRTAESRPEDFWVFNNGVTILTLAYKATPKGTKISGCSIINGAQTTGSIGSVDPKKDISKIRVLTRVVACKDAETIKEIVRFNNTQNEITTWDQYSSNESQKSLVTEFAALGHSYSVKRGFGESLSGLGIEVVAQPILAFEGHFEDAHRGKNTIFDRKATYGKAFEGKSARHVLLAYTLAQAIDAVRQDLKILNNAGQLIKAKESHLRFGRHVRFKYFFMAVVAASLESLLNRPVVITEVRFTQTASNAQSFTITELIGKWKPVVETLLALTVPLIQGDPGETFSSNVEKDRIAKTVESLIIASGLSEKHTDFAALIE